MNERAVKMTEQMLYKKVVFGNYDNADDVLVKYLLVEVNERRRPALDPLNDVNVIH